MVFIEQEDYDFSKQVEKYVTDNGGTYLDAVLCICEENNVSPELMAKKITKPLKEKLQIEAIELNYRLPNVGTSLF